MRFWTRIVILPVYYIAQVVCSSSSFPQQSQDASDTGSDPASSIYPLNLTSSAHVTAPKEAWDIECWTSKHQTMEINLDLCAIAIGIFEADPIFYIQATYSRLPERSSHGCTVPIIWPPRPGIRKRPEEKCFILLDTHSPDGTDTFTLNDISPAVAKIVDSCVINGKGFGGRSWVGPRNIFRLTLEGLRDTAVQNSTVEEESLRVVNGQ